MARNCNLRPVFAFFKEDLPPEHRNSSAVAMLENKEIDFYSLPTDMTLVSHGDRSIEATKAVRSSAYLVGQFLRPPENSERSRSDLTSFLFENLHLLAIIVSGYLLAAVLMFLFSPIIQPHLNRPKRLKLAVFKALSIDSNEFYSVSFKLGVLFLFLNVFLFFTQIFLSGSTKTNLITIDTSFVIDSASKLLQADEKTMIVDYEEDYAMTSALEHSFLGRLAKKRRLVLHEIMQDEDWNALMAQPMDAYVFLAKESDHSFIMSGFSDYSELSGLVAFISPHFYGESFLQVFYLRRSLEEEKKRLIHQR